jgi:hypothetical protein
MQLKAQKHVTHAWYQHLQDYRRQYQLEPLVKEDLLQKQGNRVRATVRPWLQHTTLHYIT